MGSMLKPICACGYESDQIPVGGGMSNFNVFCGFPAICAKCKKVVVLNYLEADHHCPTCHGAVTFYDDPSTHGDGKMTVFDWNLEDGKKLRLSESQNLCPRCGKKTLKFQHWGCWD